MSRLPVAGPWITQKEIDYVADAAARDWYEGAGEYTRRFERAFAGHLKTKHAVSLPNCTAGLHLSLAALGIGAGDEVIVPELTWIATAAPVQYVGATVRFADVDPTTWCLSAKSFEENLTPKTKAVIAVHLYGSMCDMDAIREIAQHHRVAVIEDAAEAIGSEWRGGQAGSFGAFGTFSFHGSKTLSTGEGGMLSTDSEELYQRVLVLRDHGRLPGDRFFQNTEVAFKYKMSGVQAALGLAQLERINELVEKKRTIFGWYESRLGALPGVALNTEPAGTRNSYWMSTAVLDPSYQTDSFELMARLDAHGIDSRPFFRPLSSLPAFRSYASAEGARQRNPNSYRVGPLGINLPSALRLEEADVERVCSAFTSAVASIPRVA